jgi:hypothetical protein
MSSKKSFLLYIDSLVILDKMNDEQAGKLFKLIYQFQTTGNANTDDFGLDMALTPFINQFKRDIEKYNDIASKNSDNGIKSSLTKFTNLVNTKSKSELQDMLKNTQQTLSDDPNNQYYKCCLDILQRALTKSTTVNAAQRPPTKSTDKDNDNDKDNVTDKDILLLQAEEYLNHFNALFGTNYKSTKQIIKPLAYWLDEYSLDDIKSALTKSKEIETFEAGICREDPLKLIRQSNKNGGVDYIGNMLNAKSNIKPIRKEGEPLNPQSYYI